MRKLIRAAMTLLTLTFLGGQLALAAEPQPYTQKSFDQMAAAGTPMIVFVHAAWCPVCAVQKPIVDSLANSAPYKNVKVLVVDFDTQKKALRSFDVSRQSTLIAFRGKKEVGRLVGTTQKDLIEVLFQRAAGKSDG